MKNHDNDGDRPEAADEEPEATNPSTTEQGVSEEVGIME